jgi:predicted KAP-like P-loop ATPase
MTFFCLNNIFYYVVQFFINEKFDEKKNNQEKIDEILQVINDSRVY